MTTTNAREAIRQAAAENGWALTYDSDGFVIMRRDGYGVEVSFSRRGPIVTARAQWLAEHEQPTKGKCGMVLSWLTQYGAKAQPTPAPAPVAPDTLEPGGHQQALKDAELVNWISTRMAGLRLDSRNHREQLAALARTETIARLSRHLRGAMVAEEQLHVFQDALTAAVHRPVDRPLTQVILEQALEPYLTFQTPGTEQERERRVAALQAAQEIAKEMRTRLDGVR